jgi:hypothetical protein
MRILLLEADCSTFLLQAEDGQTILVQTDWDFPGVASTFGWSPPPGTPIDPTGNFPEDVFATLIADARDFLHERAGSTADDPGYF